MNHIFTHPKQNKIEFKDSRFYSADDEKDRIIPSVTTLLQAAPKNAQYYEWLKKYGNATDTIAMDAMEKGSTVHSLCERYDNGEEICAANDLYEPLYSREEWEQFNRYVEFSEKHKPQLLMNERSFALASLGWAGTLDRVYELNGTYWLIDLKTGNMYDYYWMQLAAYKKLITHAYYDLPYNELNLKVGILHLNAKTRGEDKKGLSIQGAGWCLEVPDKDEDYYYQSFLHTKAMWEFQNPNWKSNSKLFNLTVKKSFGIVEPEMNGHQ